MCWSDIIYDFGKYVQIPFNFFYIWVRGEGGFKTMRKRNKNPQCEKGYSCTCEWIPARVQVDAVFEKATGAPW